MNWIERDGALHREIKTPDFIVLQHCERRGGARRASRTTTPTSSLAGATCASSSRPTTPVA